MQVRMISDLLRSMCIDFLPRWSESSLGQRKVIVTSSAIAPPVGSYNLGNNVLSGIQGLLYRNEFSPILNQDPHTIFYYLAVSDCPSDTPVMGYSHSERFCRPAVIAIMLFECFYVVFHHTKTISIKKTKTQAFSIRL